MSFFTLYDTYWQNQLHLKPEVFNFFELFKLFKLKRAGNVRGIQSKIQYLRIYIDKTTRKCKVEKCSVKFGEQTSTASLIYHINNEHKIVVNDESLLGCNSEDKFLGSQNQNSQSSNSHKTGSQNDPYRRKHGTAEQTKRDSALLVIIGKKI